MYITTIHKPYADIYALMQQSKGIKSELGNS